MPLMKLTLNDQSHFLIDVDDDPGLAVTHGEQYQRTGGLELEANSPYTVHFGSMISTWPVKELGSLNNAIKNDETLYIKDKNDSIVALVFSKNVTSLRIV